MPTSLTTLSRLHVDAATAVGGAVSITNSAQQVADAPVSIVGTAGQAALTIAAGNLVVDGGGDLAMVGPGGLLSLGWQTVAAAATIELTASHATVTATAGDRGVRGAPPHTHTSGRASYTQGRWCVVLGPSRLRASY